MRPVILAITATLLGAVGCVRRAPLNVMTISADCDSVPPAVSPAARRTAQIPQAASLDGRGAVSGTVTEAGTGQPLGYADASLKPTVTAGGTLGPVRVDSLGGFAFVSVPPGAYTLRVRAINHRYAERHVEVRAGSADTVRA